MPSERVTLRAATCYRSIVAALAVLVGAVAPVHAQKVPDLAPSAGVKRFIFNEGFSSSGGLKFYFDRPVATVDQLGNAVRANAPRYAAETSIASAPVYERIRASSSPILMLGSGLDHDGTTPLLVVLESRAADQYLDVFAGNGAAVAQAEITGVGRTRTIISPAGDMMGGTVAGKRYRPTSAVVCHGLIVMFCTVLNFDSSTNAWRDAANAFIVSQNRGQTWTLTYESAVFAPGAMRGAPWTMQNWWPTKYGAPPNEAYFVATDYCANPGSPGGRLYAMRATRATVGAPWTVHPGTPIYSSIGQTDEHIHAGGILPYGHGIRAFLALGDRRENNRIISMLNPSGDYLAGAWDVQENYHGAAGNPGIEGNQFVGCAPGPLPGTVLVGADVTAEQVMLLSFPDGHPGAPKTRRLVGLPTSDGRPNNVFSIRSPTPERGGPYCANSDVSLTVPIPRTSRTLYSPDGLHWAQAATPDGGYPILHAEHLYFDGAPGRGIVRTAVPTVLSGRPLLVGPGGMQHSRANPDIAGAGTRFVALSRNAQGLWVDDGVVLQPQPPSMGPVYRVRTTSTDPSPWIARVYPGGLSNRINRILGNQVMLRVWCLNTDPTRCATLAMGIGDSIGAPQTYRGTIIPATGTWVPLMLSGSIELPPNAAFQLHVRSSGEVSADQTMYFALDSLQEGIGSPGYAMPPDASPSPFGSTRPDEIARVTHFRCEKAWTITLAMQLPEDGFDFRTELQRSWPLATLWGDANNHIQLIANTDAGTVRAVVTVGGRVAQTMTSDDASFVRGAPILVSIAQESGKAAPEMTISSVGLGLETVTLSLPAAARLNTPPQEIRFHAANPVASSTGRGTPVSTLQIWGGRVDEKVGLPRTTREAMLRDLSFLSQPLR